MSTLAVGLTVAVLTFASGMAGLVFTRRANYELTNAARDLIKVVTGLVATLAALVLGLLIAEADSFYTTQRNGLEVLSARVLELDAVLRQFGPEAKPVRDLLKETLVSSYRRVWHAEDGGSAALSLAMPREGGQTLTGALSSLQPKTDAQKLLQSTALGIVTSTVNQRLALTLQANNSISLNFEAILVSWLLILFFCFGLLGQDTALTRVTMGLGAFTLASAVFLVAELRQPYSGLLRMSPAPLEQAIAVLGK
jgi:hypothetical protein